MQKFDRTQRARATLFGLGGLGLLLSVAACSDGGGLDDPEPVGMFPNAAAGAGPSAPNGVGAAGAPAGGVGVAGYDRPPGMPIGRGDGGAGGEGGVDPVIGGSASGAGGAGTEPAIDDDGLVIPPVEPPPELGPPCSGCVELNVDVDDINQRDDFVFNAGGVAVTRVVWTVIIPFNSDQLFVQPFVDNNYGTFTDLDANAFAVGTPVQLVQAYTGNATMVGLAMGSSGAWTGDMTMSVFVDSVTLEGAAPAASRSFDAGAQGLTNRTNARNPGVVFHP